MYKNSNKNCNCPCHLCDKSMISYSNIFNSIYPTKTKYNNIQKVCRSADNIGKLNMCDFNLIDKYYEFNDLNKKYNDIKKQLDNFDKEKKERIIYIKKLEHNLSISSEGKYNEYGINKFFFRNYSNSDKNIKFNNCINNRSFNNLLEKTQNILNSSSFLNDSDKYNINKNYNLYSPNLSYSFCKEKKNYFSPLFENIKNKRYLSNSTNYIIPNQDHYFHKNKNSFKDEIDLCIRNAMSYNKEIWEKKLSRSEKRANKNKNDYITKNGSLIFKNLKYFDRLNTFSNNDLTKSFGNRYSHYSLDETIHSSINKNSNLPHPKSFGKDEVDRNIFFLQNSENNKNKNRQKRIEENNNIKIIGNNTIFEENEKNPFKTKANENYSIQKINNIAFCNKRNNIDNELISNKRDSKEKIICENNFNLINDKKYLYNENIKLNNKNINTNIIDKVDNFNIIHDINSQKRYKLKSYNNTYDNILRDNIISFNYLKGKNLEKKYDKKKFIDNKKENVNNINIFPAKKNKIPSKKKLAKNSPTKMKEKRIDNINKIIEKILSKNNQIEDKENKQKNNIKKLNNKNAKKDKNLEKKKIFQKIEKLKEIPILDNPFNYSLSNTNQIKKNLYHFNKNDGDININKQIYQLKPSANNNKIKIEIQKNLEYQIQNENNINLFNSNNYHKNSKDKKLLSNHKTDNSKIILNKTKDNFNSFYGPKEKDNKPKYFLDNELNNRDNINENSIFFKLINGNNPFNAKNNRTINGNNELNGHNKHKVNYEMNNKSQNIKKSNPKILPIIHELNENNHNKNNCKNIQNNEDKRGPKISIEENSNNIFKKINKRSKSNVNLINKKSNKNKQKNNKLENFKRNNIPYLGFLNMNEIKKLNRLNKSKNTLFHNNIKSFNKVKTLNNRSNNKLIYKEIKTYESNKIINSKIDDIINGKKNIFDLSFADKKRYIKYNKSCIFHNFLKLGKINYMTKNRSVYISSCFACDLGCSISKSGYSPMTYSPYPPMKIRRKEITEIPKNIIYEQYTRHKIS